MNKPYTSFLACFHDGHTDLYITGMTLAIIKSDGIEIPKVNPLTQVGCAFANVSELRAALNAALDALPKEETQS